MLSSYRTIVAAGTWVTFFEECQQQSCEQACPLELHGSFSIQATSCDLELNQYGEWAKDGGGLRIANVTGGGKLSMKDICELALHRVAAWDWQLDRQTWEAFDRLDARRCRDAGLVPHRRLRYRDVSRLPAPAPPRRHCCSAHRIIVCCRWDGNDDGYSSSPFPTFEIGEEASELRRCLLVPLPPRPPRALTTTTATDD